jgi:hypothetical protein
MSNVRVLDTPIPSAELFLESTHATRSDATGSRCVWNLPHSGLSAPSNVVQLGVVATASIPISFYNCPVGSVLTLSQAGYSKTVPLVSGNYSLTQFLSHVDELLRDCGWAYTDGDGVAHTRPTLAWSARTNKITFAHTAALTLGAGSTIQRLLGFTPGRDHVGTTTLTSDSCCDVRGHHMLYLNANFVSNHMSTIVGSTRTIAHIPVTVGVYATEIWRSSGGTACVIPNHTSHLELSLCDSLGAPIALNRMAWSVTLRVDYVYAAVLLLPTQLDPSALAWSHSYRAAVAKKQLAANAARQTAIAQSQARVHKISLLQKIIAAN